jgi:hypothetical protein
MFACGERKKVAIESSKVQIITTAIFLANIVFTGTLEIDFAMPQIAKKMKMKKVILKKIVSKIKSLILNVAGKITLSNTK